MGISKSHAKIIEELDICPYMLFKLMQALKIGEKNDCLSENDCFNITQTYRNNFYYDHQFVKGFRDLKRTLKVAQNIKATIYQRNKDGSKRMELLEEWNKPISPKV
ncbi:MAG: hypothetical protein ABJZ91_19820, partial [Cyclobacteriaceae bacterium]